MPGSNAAARYEPLAFRVLEATPRMPDVWL